jgi:hypothetical protein
MWKSEENDSRVVTFSVLHFSVPDPFSFDLSLHVSVFTGSSNLYFNLRIILHLGTIKDGQFVSLNKVFFCFICLREICVKKAVNKYLETFILFFNIQKIYRKNFLFRSADFNPPNLHMVQFNRFRKTFSLIVTFFVQTRKPIWMFLLSIYFFGS